MKYLQIVSAPSPIESWLHSQLEARGVDRVYSRYILSLFHSSDVGDHDFLDLDIPCKELKRLNKKKSPRHLSRSVDTHKLVRASVIETLRSVAETKAGIETLVDELCDRLHSNEKTTLSLPGTKSLIAAQSLNNVSVACGVVDLAQKYYDAFPALGSNPQPSTTLLLASCNSSSSPWNGKHQSLLSSSVSTEKPGICVDPTSDSKVNLALPCGNPLNVTEPAPPTGQTSSLVASPGGGNAKLDQDSERRMDCSMRAKRKLFVEVEEAKDSLASLMEKVDGTKQLWAR